MSPKDKPGQLSNFTASGYKLHCYRTVSGYQFVILTPPTAPNLRERLRVFFSQVFLPLVVMNPLYELNTPIQLAAFDAAVDAFDWDKKA
jgi:hypothetical protein